MISQTTNFYEEIKKIEVKRKYVYVYWCNGRITKSLKDMTDIDFSVTVRHMIPLGEII